MMKAASRIPTPVIVAILLGLAGCGSSSHSGSASESASESATSTSTTTTGPATTGPPPAVSELAPAEHPRPQQFPPAGGRTLQQLAATVRSSAQLGAATGTFTPGVGRFAFALNTSSGAFIYAPTALYIGRTPKSPAQGPFIAPADPMSESPLYRSKQTTGPCGIQAIYATQLPLPKGGA